MDDLSSSLPQLGIILVCAISGTVFLIQKTKMLVSKHSKRKLPAWFWLGASIVVPVAIVLFMLQPWMQSWLNTLLPSNMQLAVSPSDVFATGASAVIGSNGAYAAAKKLGLAADYSAPTPEAPMEPTTPVVAPDEPQGTVAAPDAIIPTPQPDTQEACAVTAEILYRKDGSEAAVELVGPTGKRRLVLLKT